MFFPVSAKAEKEKRERDQKGIETVGAKQTHAGSGDDIQDPDAFMKRKIRMQGVYEKAEEGHGKKQCHTAE